MGKLKSSCAKGEKMNKTIRIYDESAKSVGNITFDRKGEVSTKIIDKDYQWIEEKVKKFLENPEYLYSRNKIPFYQLSILKKDKNRDNLPLVIREMLMKLGLDVELVNNSSL